MYHEDKYIGSLLATETRSRDKESFREENTERSRGLRCRARINVVSCGVCVRADAVVLNSGRTHVGWAVVCVGKKPKGRNAAHVEHIACSILMGQPIYASSPTLKRRQRAQKHTAATLFFFFSRTTVVCIHVVRKHTNPTTHIRLTPLVRTTIYKIEDHVLGKIT